MADTAKKTAQTTPDKADEKIETPEGLSPDYQVGAEVREFGSVTHYEFPDGTGAKVWTVGKDHFGVQLRDREGRGLSSTTFENLTIKQANDKLVEAGQKAADEVAKTEAAN